MYMQNREYHAELKIRIMAGQVYAASELGMWCFSPVGDLFFTTCPNEKEILSLLQLNGTLDYFVNHVNGWDKPVILNDDLGLVFIGETIYEEATKNSKLNILVGPFFLNSSSVKEIENRLREMISSIQAQRALLRILQKVPVLNISALDMYASMLHYTISDELIQHREYYHQERESQGLETTESEQLEREVLFAGNIGKEDRETDYEQRILQAIRDGNLQAEEIMNKASGVADHLATTSGSQLRDGKNTLLILNALCSRAAIEGGVPLGSGRFMEKSYYEKIERCSSISELCTLSNQMIPDYIHKVRDCKDNSQISKEIQEVCDFIRANVQKELTVEDLAEHSGYTTYYFSKKFSKEMGIRVIDFIKSARIDYAKILLISTNKSIQDISDSLHFGTRNYFSTVFREMTGTTPASFREKGILQTS